MRRCLPAAGRDADFAEHFLNSDDVVPSTNFALPLCYVYDVTGSKERLAFFTPILSPTLPALTLTLKP